MEIVRKRIIQSIAVGAVALVMCIVTVVLVQHTAVIPQPSLADRVPGSGAVLFFRGSSMEDLAAVEGILAIEGRLTSPLPAFGSGSYELAVLERGGTWQWVLQRTTASDTEVSGPAIGVLIADNADHSRALSHQPEFRRMDKRLSPAVWFRSDVLTLGTPQSDLLLGAALAPYSHIQFGWGHSARTLSLIRTERASLASRPAGPVGSAPADSLDLLDPALGQRLQMTMDALKARSPALQEGISGILAQAWQTQWNAGSVEFEKAAKTLAGIRVRHGTGGLAFAFAFQGLDAKQTDALLDAFAAGLPQTEIRNLELKKNDRTDISVDDAAVQRGEETVGGWKLRWVSSKEGDKTLAAAERGPRTLIAADAGLLREMIAETAPPVQSTASATAPAAPQSGGRLNPILLDQAVSMTLPMFAKEPDSLFWKLLGAAGNVRWTASAMADADILTLEEAR